MCFVCICIRIYLNPGLLYGRGQLNSDSHQVQPLSAPPALSKIAYNDYYLFQVRYCFSLWHIDCM